MFAPLRPPPKRRRRNDCSSLLRPVLFGSLVTLLANNYFFFLLQQEQDTPTSASKASLLLASKTTLLRGEQHQQHHHHQTQAHNPTTNPKRNHVMMNRTSTSRGRRRGSSSSSTSNPTTMLPHHLRVLPDKLYTIIGIGQETTAKFVAITLAHALGLSLRADDNHQNKNTFYTTTIARGMSSSYFPTNSYSTNENGNGYLTEVQWIPLPYSLIDNNYHSNTSTTNSTTCHDDNAPKMNIIPVLYPQICYRALNTTSHDRNSNHFDNHTQHLLIYRQCLELIVGNPEDNATTTTGTNNENYTQDWKHRVLHEKLLSQQQQQNQNYNFLNITSHIEWYRNSNPNQNIDIYLIIVTRDASITKKINKMSTTNPCGSITATASTTPPTTTANATTIHYHDTTDETTTMTTSNSNSIRIALNIIKQAIHYYILHNNDNDDDNDYFQNRNHDYDYNKIMHNNNKTDNNSSNPLHFQYRIDYSRSITDKDNDKTNKQPPVKKRKEQRQTNDNRNSDKYNNDHDTDNASMSTNINDDGVYKADDDDGFSNNINNANDDNDDDAVASEDDDNNNDKKAPLAEKATARRRFLSEEEVPQNINTYNDNVHVVLVSNEVLNIFSYTYMQLLYKKLHINSTYNPMSTNTTQWNLYINNTENYLQTSYLDETRKISMNGYNRRHSAIKRRRKKYGHNPQSLPNYTSHNNHQMEDTTIHHQTKFSNKVVHQAHQTLKHKKDIKRHRHVRQTNPRNNDLNSRDYAVRNNELEMIEEQRKYDDQIKGKSLANRDAERIKQILIQEKA